MAYNGHMDIQKLNEALGAEVRGARARAGYSRDKLSELSGVGVRTLQRIENGERPADISQMAAICGALKEDLAELVDRALAAIGE